MMKTKLKDKLMPPFDVSDTAQCRKFGEAYDALDELEKAMEDERAGVEEVQFRHDDAKLCLKAYFDELKTATVSE